MKKDQKVSAVWDEHSVAVTVQTIRGYVSKCGEVVEVVLTCDVAWRFEVVNPMVVVQSKATYCTEGAAVAAATRMAEGVLDLLRGLKS